METEKTYMVQVTESMWKAAARHNNRLLNAGRQNVTTTFPINID